MIGSELVRTTVFSARNVEKTAEGHVGRAAVALGQAKNVFDAVKELDCGLAKSAQSASNALHVACENDAIVNGFYKVADKCSRNINPLIWASAGLDVLCAENKKEALVENVSAIGTMRITEEVMKKYLDKGVDKAIKNVKNSNITKKIAGSNAVKGVTQKLGKLIKSNDNKLLKMLKKGGISSLLKGGLFVIGSCLAYDLGKKFADDVLLGKKETAES